jgi:site-specific recombinase XerD
MAYISEDIVFFDQKHGILSNHSINKYLKNYLTTLNISPIITATGTRHTYISVLLAKKYDIKTVAKIVGHKNTIQIRETYGHLLKEEYDSEWQAIKETMGEF